MATILTEAGLEPAPERRRQRTWKQFLQSHAETLYACDFFAVEVLSVLGTVRHLVFFVMHVKSRAVRIAGIRVAPDGAWMKQVARNLVDPEDGFLRQARFLIHDRDPLFTHAWAATLKASGVTCVPIPAQSPNCNAHAERFVRTIRAECLDHFVIFSERHLRHLLREFTEHYLSERYHQGIGGRIIAAKANRSKSGCNYGSHPMSLPARRSPQLLPSGGCIASTTAFQTRRDIEETNGTISRFIGARFSRAMFF